MNIIIAIVIFSAIILFHELGHFLFAKLNKIVVTEFFWEWDQDFSVLRKGDTRYSLKTSSYRWPPLCHAGEDTT